MTERKYWFAAKKSGLGWSWPIAWQGWVAVLAFIAFVVGAKTAFPPESSPYAYFGVLSLGVVGFLLVVWRKGEPQAAVGE